MTITFRPAVRLSGSEWKYLDPRGLLIREAPITESVEYPIPDGGIVCARNSQKGWDIAIEGWINVDTISLGLLEQEALESALRQLTGETRFDFAIFTDSESLRSRVYRSCWVVPPGLVLDYQPGDIPMSVRYSFSIRSGDPLRYTTGGNSETQYAPPGAGAFEKWSYNDSGLVSEGEEGGGIVGSAWHHTAVFPGELVATDADNVAWMQKVITATARSGITQVRVKQAQVVGCFGRGLGGASGNTILRVSDAAYNGSSGNVLTMTLGAANSSTSPTGGGGFLVPVGSPIYVYCTLAEGGHEGVQVELRMEEV